MLERNFSKVINQIGRNPRSYVQDHSSDIFNLKNFDRRKAKRESSLENAIQCSECAGLGHFEIEYPTYQKKRKNGSKSNCDKEVNKHEKALTGRWVTIEDSGNDDLSYDELDTYFERLFQVSEKQKDLIHTLKRERGDQLKTMARLEE